MSELFRQKINMTSEVTQVVTHQSTTNQRKTNYGRRREGNQSINQGRITYIHVGIVLTPSSHSSSSSLHAYHHNIFRFAHQVHQNCRPDWKLGNVEGTSSVEVFKVPPFSKILQPLHSVWVTARVAQNNEGLDGSLSQKVSQVGPHDIVVHGGVTGFLIAVPPRDVQCRGGMMGPSS